MELEYIKGKVETYNFSNWSSLSTLHETYRVAQHKEDGHFHCHCRYILKNFICTHSLGMDLTVSAVQIPVAVQKQLADVAVKTKRGRKKHALPALQHQPFVFIVKKQNKNKKR